ncbi:MAG: sigma 54-interacting transcriptional regulator [Salinivirgaceae bacterium]|nr:sigma 54-interacting transcriptional regulator [Salinivirgaceae bacterium]
MRCPKTENICYGVKELTLLSEISTQLMKSKNTPEELYSVLQYLCEYLDAENSMLSIFDINTSTISIEVAYGLNKLQQDRGQYKLGEGIIGRVVEMVQPVVIPKISQSNLFLNKTKLSLKKEGNELTFICVPVLVDGKVGGTLSLTRKYNENIDIEEDKRLISIVGGLIIQAVKTSKERRVELDQLRLENTVLQTQLTEDKSTFNMVGNSGKMADVISLIKMVGPTHSTVLIRGESGCGKELVAEAIHAASNVKTKPLIKVNCSALPESLIESELFGHEKGAFTGADSMRKGRFEMAEGGTIFLDELGDIPLTTQVKLLRVLQEREFERVGGTETVKCNVRIICATNRNLEELIETDKFREDFYYRINVFPIFIPRLRERRNDIPLLADHFIAKFNKKNKTKIKRITTSALDMLMVYNWPGNIRELENVIERACILTTDGVINSHHLPPTLQTAESSGTQSTGGMTFFVEKLERQLIREALVTNKGNMAKAAIHLQVTERMLTTRIKKYGIEVWRFKV